MKDKSIKITGAILSNDYSMQISYKEMLTDEFANEIVTTNNEIKIKSDRKAHSDLRHAFRELNYHLTILTDQFRHDAMTEAFVNQVMSKNEIEPIGLEQNYAQDVMSKTLCLGIIIKGTGQKEAVKIQGVRLVNAGVIDLTSPSVQINESNYKYLTEFRLAIDDVKHECELYLDGKCEESSQVDMFESESNSNGAEVSFGITNKETGEVEYSKPIKLDKLEKTLNKRMKKAV